MTGNQTIAAKIDEYLQGIAPHHCSALALRAALRTLPLLMLYSEGIEKGSFTVEPFGFWPEDGRDARLLELLQGTGVVVQEIHEQVIVNKPLRRSEIEITYTYQALLSLLSTIFMPEEPEEPEEFPSVEAATRWNAFRVSSILARNTIGSIYAIIDSLCSEAEHESIINESYERHAQAALPASALCRQVAVCLRDYLASPGSAGELAESIAAVVHRATDEAMTYTNYLIKRFASHSAMVLEIAPTLGNPEVLISYASLAKAASEELADVAREIQAGNRQRLSTAYYKVIATVERYEAARMAMVSFYPQIDFELFIDIEPRTYEALALVLTENFVITGIERAAAAAETLADAFALVAQPDFSVNAVGIALGNFNSAYDSLHDHKIAIIHTADSAIDASFDVFEYMSRQQRYADELDNKHLRRAAIESIEAAMRASSADIAACSTYTTVGISAAAWQLLQADIAFLREHSATELVVQDLWLLPDISDSDTSVTQRQLALEGIATSRELWQLFKRNTLQLKPDGKALLACYDNLFAGNSIDLARLAALLKAPVRDQQLEDRYRNYR